MSLGGRLHCRVEVCGPSCLYENVRQVLENGMKLLGTTIIRN
jgi:hypothetical protein